MSSGHPFSDGARPQLTAEQQRLASASRQPRLAGVLSTAPVTLGPFERFISRPYFAELDGLRAISILLVISFHLRDQRWLWLAGDNGVTIFFVISGFLITPLAIREERKTGRLDLKSFLLRRAFRLLPIYYVVLGAYAVAILTLQPAKAPGLLHALPYLAFYFQEYPHYAGWTYPLYQTWSLGIEEKFYLLWPLLAFRVALPFSRLRLTLSACALFGICALSPIGLLVFPYFHILVGCALAFLSHEPVWFERLRKLTSGHRCWVWIAGFLLVHLTGDQMPSLSLGYPVLIGMVIASSVIEERGILRWLSSSALAYLGTLSYGIYLVHLAGISAAERLFSSSPDSLARSPRSRPPAVVRLGSLSC